MHADKEVEFVYGNSYNGFYHELGQGQGRLNNWLYGTLEHSLFITTDDCMYGYILFWSGLPSLVAWFM